MKKTMSSPCLLYSPIPIPKIHKSGSIKRSATTMNIMEIEYAATKVPIDQVVTCVSSQVTSFPPEILTIDKEDLATCIATPSVGESLFSSTTVEIERYVKILRRRLQNSQL